MKLPLIFLSHPITADDTHSVEANIAEAREILKALLAVGANVICPWLAATDLLDWSTQQARDLGRAIGRSTVARCDILLLTGHRIAPGMNDEAQAFYESPGALRPIIDATGRSIPEIVEAVVSFHQQGVRQLIRVEVEPAIVKPTGKYLELVQ